MRPKADVVSEFPKIASKAWEAKQGDSEKELRKLRGRLEDQKRRRRKLVESMLEGTISKETFNDMDGECRAELAVTEQELETVQSQRGTQEAFLRFAEIHLMDLSKAWELAGPEQRQPVQSLLFDGGLEYSPSSGI
jgi:hypothetical protein